MNRPAAIAFLALFSASLLLVGAGCEPELSEEDLGRVEYRMPEEAEIGRKYELPDLSSEEPTEEVDEEAVDGEAADEEAAADEAGANGESAG